MANEALVSMTAYRKRKSRSHLLEALERFQTEVLLPNNPEQSLLDSEELEEFLSQVLADHLIGKVQSSQDIRGMDQQYRQFDQRLRRAMQLKLKSLARFEHMQ